MNTHYKMSALDDIIIGSDVLAGSFDKQMIRTNSSPKGLCNT